MSNNQNWYDDDEFDYEEETQSNSNDSDAMRKVRKAERMKDKQLKEALAELETLRKFQRESIVSRVLSEKGVNPQIAAFIPQDVEPTAEAVSSWLDVNGSVFGIVKEEAPVAPAMSQEEVSIFQQINAAVSGAQSPDDANDASRSISNAQTKEEIMRLFGQ